jgi:import inner membrane translocase subunit TIM21
MNGLIVAHLETHCQAHSWVLKRHILTLSAGPFLNCLAPRHGYHTGVACQQQAKPKSEQHNKKQALVESKDRPFAELTLGEKVKQVGSDATYTGIVIAGIAVTGFMFYAIGRELFSGQSPSGIYSRAFKTCKKTDKVIDTFGEPLKAYGEMTSRGRRRFVRHTEFELHGVKYIRLMFYLEGPHSKGTVHVEAKQDNHGKYQFEYILVEPDTFPRRTIVVEDNR